MHATKSIPARGEFGFLNCLVDRALGKGDHNDKPGIPVLYRLSCRHAAETRLGTRDETHH